MSTRIRQAPGWWPSLVQAVCECHWIGPVRNVYQDGNSQLVEHDRYHHKCDEAVQS